MGYFKDWQKNRRTIREALNRLPGEQQPGRPADGQELHRYISNTPQDISRMEQDADRKELEAAMKNADQALRTLAMLEPEWYWSRKNQGTGNKALADYVEANPELERELSVVSGLLSAVYKYLYIKWRHLDMPTLSQAMTPPPNERPQGMN